MFATVFLGSGLLFVALLFTAAAMTGGLVTMLDSGQAVSSDVVRLTSASTAVLVGTLAIRMAGVFTLVVSNLGRRTGILPRWLVAWGFMSGLVLLLSPVSSIWVAMLFPLWVIALSTFILVNSFGPPPAPLPP